MSVNLADTLEAIAAEMDGRQWNADTCHAVAEHLRAAGYRVRDIDEVDRDVQRAITTGACDE